jgi:hypothetical protein
MVPRWLEGDLHFQPNPLTPLRAIIPPVGVGTGILGISQGDV